MQHLLLIDGYNVAQPIAPGKRPPSNWLQRTRNRMISCLAQFLPKSLRKKTCVVFDAAKPPRGVSDRYVTHEIEIRYAVGYNSADDLLEELIRANQTPKRLTVISSDHRIQVAATRRGASAFDSEPWMDDLTDGKLRLSQHLSEASLNEMSGTGSQDGAGQGGAKPKIASEDEVADWMREFGFDDP